VVLLLNEVWAGPFFREDRKPKRRMGMEIATLTSPPVFSIVLPVASEILSLFLN
jgi:hypothetical protein